MSITVGRPYSYARVTVIWQGAFRRLTGIDRLGPHAEDAGIHRVSLGDHVLLCPGTEAYCWRRFPVPTSASTRTATTVYMPLRPFCHDYTDAAAVLHRMIRRFDELTA
jgi:hypothetical protein